MLLLTTEVWSPLESVDDVPLTEDISTGYDALDVEYA